MALSGTSSEALGDMCMASACFGVTTRGEAALEGLRPDALKGMLYGV